MKNRTLGGILLVAGTATGAGMLALPISTGLSGFLPSLALFVIYWLYMTYTAFLFLEATLWLDQDTNLISMAQHTLGIFGKAAAWVSYLFLLYALTTAYIAGSTPIFVDTLQALTGWSAPYWVGAIPLLIIFGFFVYQGAQAVDYINRVLMIGLAIAYCTLLVLLTPSMQTDKLQHVDWRLLTVGISVVATSFGFHIIIPTLANYLHRNVRQLILVIFAGSLIPLAVYTLWEIYALSIIPLEGANSITAGYLQGVNAAELMADALSTPSLSLTARGFAFFAIVTSFLGVSLSLLDFLADGFKIKKSAGGKALLYCLTFIPPLAIALTDPRAFLGALEYAGAFGVVILLGFMPALMVWRGRYHHCYPSLYTAPRGKPALAITMLFSIMLIGIEIANKLGWLNPFANP